MESEISSTEPKPEKTGFSLSRSNRIYFGVIAGLNIVAAVWLSDGSQDVAYVFGTIVGRLLVFFIIPWVCGWVAYACSRNVKPDWGGSAAFNIVLTLVLLSQAYTTVGRFTPQEKFDQIMSQLDAEGNASNRKWQQSCREIQADGILSCSVLTSDEEFDRQRKIVTSYIENTKVHKALYATMLSKLKRRLGSSGRNDPGIKDRLAEVRDAYSRTDPIFNPVMQAHMEYGQGMIRILDFLQKNKSEWSNNNGIPSFRRPSVAGEYNKLIETLRNWEVKINTLSSKLQQPK